MQQNKQITGAAHTHQNSTYSPKKKKISLITSKKYFCNRKGEIRGGLTLSAGLQLREKNKNKITARFALHRLTARLINQIALFVFKADIEAQF